MNNDKPKNPQLELAMAHLNKVFGDGSVMRMDEPPQNWPAISTGSIGLDRALGIGGFPVGRIVEVYGPESSGKSTLALSTMAGAQAQGGNCLYIDMEHAYDPLYATALGVKTDDLIISQPGTGEEALDILEGMIRTSQIKVAVIDSVAALIPRAELEGNMSDNHMGLQPRMMARAMRKLPGIANETKTLVIFINQLRSKVGIIFGSPEITPGGNALKYAASQRIDLRKIENLKAKSDGTIIGSRIKAKVVKNKMAPAMRQAEFDIMYGKGINQFGEVIDIGLESGLFTKNGTWYSHNGNQIGQGRDKSVQYLASDLDLFEQIKKELISGV